MDVEFQMLFKRSEGLNFDIYMDQNIRLDGLIMGMSVFFDRKVANEDNPFFDEFDLQQMSELSNDRYYRLPDLRKEKLQDMIGQLDTEHVV